MKKSFSALAFAAAAGFSGAAGAALIDRGGGLIYDDVLNITWLQNASLFKTQYEADSTIVSQIVAAVPTIADATGTRDITAIEFAPGYGTMTWWGAMAWAQWLDFGGFDDWRLPIIAPADALHIVSNNGTTMAGFGAYGAGYGTATPSGGWGPRGDADGIWSELGWMHYHNLGRLGYCTPDGGGSSTSCDEQANWRLANTNTATPDGVVIQNIQLGVYWSGTEYVRIPIHAWYFGPSHGVQGTTYKYETYLYNAWAVRDGDVAAVPEPASVALVGLGLVALGWTGRRVWFVPGNFGSGATRAVRQLQNVHRTSPSVGEAVQ